MHPRTLTHGLGLALTAVQKLLAFAEPPCRAPDIDVAINEQAVPRRPAGFCKPSVNLPASNQTLTTKH